MAAYKLAVNSPVFRPVLYDNLPTIFIFFIREINGILFSLAMVALVGRFSRTRESILLKTLGRYSYELFLLHGVFLIKYNPVFRQSQGAFVVVSFILLLILLTGLSHVFSRISSRLQA